MAAQRLGLASWSVVKSIAEALVRRYADAIANPDDAAAWMAEIVSADLFDHVSGQVGPAIWSVVSRWNVASFADVEVEIHEIMTREDRVLVWFTATARHIGDGFPRLKGLPVTGTRVSWEQVHRFRVADERLVEHWAVRDDYALVEAIAGGPLGGCQLVPVPRLKPNSSWTDNCSAERTRKACRDRSSADR